MSRSKKQELRRALIELIAELVVEEYLDSTTDGEENERERSGSLREV